MIFLLQGGLHFGLVYNFWVWTILRLGNRLFFCKVGYTTVRHLIFGFGLRYGFLSVLRSREVGFTVGWYSIFLPMLGFGV